MRTHRYRITISGRLGDIDREAFADFDSEPSGPDATLIADLDQAALYGALARIQALGLDLAEVRRLAGNWGPHAEPRPGAAPASPAPPSWTSRLPPVRHS